MVSSLFIFKPLCVIIQFLYQNNFILTSAGTEKTLVFVEMKRNADFLASYLCQSGYPTTSIHGLVFNLK